MSELDKLLNEPEAPKQTETIIPKPITKPTAAANKANTLAEQEDTIAAASAGSSIFKSAKDFLADNPEVKGYHK